MDRPLANTPLGAAPWIQLRRASHYSIIKIIRQLDNSKSIWLYLFYNINLQALPSSIVQNRANTAFCCWNNLISFLQVSVQYVIINIMMMRNTYVLQIYIKCWCSTIHIISSFKMMMEHQIMVQMLLMSWTTPKNHLSMLMAKVKFNVSGYYNNQVLVHTYPHFKKIV